MGFITLDNRPPRLIFPTFGSPQRKLVWALMTRVDKIEPQSGRTTCVICGASAPAVRYVVDDTLFYSLSVHAAVWHWRVAMDEFAAIRNIPGDYSPGFANMALRDIPEELLLTPPGVMPEWLRAVLAKFNKLDPASQEPPNHGFTEQLSHYPRGLLAYEQGLIRQ